MLKFFISSVSHFIPIPPLHKNLTQVLGHIGQGDEWY